MIKLRNVEYNIDLWVYTDIYTIPGPCCSPSIKSTILIILNIIIEQINVLDPKLHTESRYSVVDENAHYLVV